MTKEDILHYFQDINFYYGDCMMYADLSGMLDELIAESKDEWIPVSERLPEDGQNILFSTKTDRVFEGRYFKDKTEHQWYSFRDECFAYNNVVTAWQPLPEPYKAERGGE